jgi:tetratricopeptide (TPR) repeat protein
VNRRHLAAVGVSLMAACTNVPRDPFPRGEAAMRRGDLVAALHAFESVPAAHARSADARAQAQIVEERLRRGYAALFAGIVQRSGGHDQQALECLLRARQEWPQLPALETWIAATRDRLAATDPSEPVVSFVPAVDCEDVLVPDSGDAAVVVEEVVDPPATPEFGRAEQKELFAAGQEDPIALGLVAVENRLGHGELELAVIDLLELARRHPADARVQNRLVRVLHQRALLRYGQGALTVAIGDWERVLAIQPENQVVKTLLDAVRAEASAPLR